MLGGIDDVYHLRIGYLVPEYVVVAIDCARVAFQLCVLLYP